MHRKRGLTRKARFQRFQRCGRFRRLERASVGNQRVMHLDLGWGKVSAPMRFPFRWALPVGQLLFCMFLLWSVRGMNYLQLKRTHRPETVQNVIVPTPESANWSYLSLLIPSALNMPVGVVQLPYVVVIKHEWVPRGMMVHFWRALTWPLVGTFFWWMVGRSLEAILAARETQIVPRIRVAEVVVGSVLFCFGLVLLFGLVTSTPDDRKDIWFMCFLAGGLLWGLLGFVILLAKFLQWRIVRASFDRQSASVSA